jgi:hypothetical protein
MKKTILGIAAAALGVAMSAGAIADPVTNYGNIGTPGVYASFIFNGNWTIGTENGIELALRAKNRETFALLDGSTGTYQADPGLYNGLGPKSKWNYEFSINTGSQYSLSDLSFLLSIDHDPSTGISFSSVNPLTYWVDNAFAPVPTKGFQNSQNVGFGDTPGGAFDVFQQGLYTFKLEAFDQAGALKDSVMMNVRVGDTIPAHVPEPGSMALVGAALGGLVWIRRKTASKNK